MNCRFCDSDTGTVVLDLGSQPVAKSFPPLDAPRPDPVHPLQLWLCADCSLTQLVSDAHGEAEEPLAVEPLAMVQQARLAIDLVDASGLLPAGGSVIEYPSPHGGSWLAPLAARGLRPVPVDAGERADVVLDCIGMMHDADQAAALDARVARLAPEGVLLMQYHSLSAIVSHRQWNDARHGHLAYYSTPALVGMLRRAGLEPVTAWWFDLYGGTVLLAARRGSAPAGARGTIPDDSVTRLIADEHALGVTDPAAVGVLQSAADEVSHELRERLVAARAAGRTVLGYGAASRSVPLLNHAGIGPDLLPAIADASSAKHGCRIPGVGVPIVAPAELAARRPAEVLLFVPDMLDEVRAQYPGVEANGGRWVVLDPRPRVAEPLAVRTAGRP